MTAEITDQVENQLKAARRNLLDITLRNRLINYRPSKVRSIQVLDEIPAEIFNILVLEEKRMSFLAAPDTAGSMSFITNQTPNQSNMNAAVDERHIDHYLQTGLEKEALQSRLFRIYNEAQLTFEELGYTFLHLALGFLQWIDPRDPLKEKHRAPLILIPIEMHRTEIRSVYRITWNGDEIKANISLQEKLKELDQTIPDFSIPETKHGIEEYFQLLEQAIRGRSDWKIDQDVALDFFSFSKICMYKDLDPECWPNEVSPAKNPLIVSLFGPIQVETEGFREEDVDEKLNLLDLFHVLDADPSQIAVMEDAKNNRNLVVEGPPGTGKSQTIANLIAELLAQGKFVLFVSEKMAALEVVQSRLNDVGLSPFCLELHSRKTNKKELIAQLKRTFDLPQPTAAQMNGEFQRLFQFRQDLNQYVKDLREPLQPFCHSPYQIIGLRAEALYHLEHHSLTRQYPLLDSRDITPQAYEEARLCLQKITTIAPSIQPIQQNPWFGCSPSRLLPNDMTKLEGHIRNLLEIIDNLIKQSQRILNTKLPMPNTIQEVQTSVGFAEQEANSFVAIAELIAGIPKFDPSFLFNSTWEEQPRIRTLREQLALVQQQTRNITEVFSEQTLNLDIEGSRILLKKYQVPWRFLINKYRTTKKNLTRLYREWHPKSDSEILLDLEAISKCQRTRSALRSEQSFAESLMGDLWQAEKTDLGFFDQIVGRAVSFRQFWQRVHFSLDLFTSSSYLEKQRSILSLIPLMKKEVSSFLAQYEVIKGILAIDESILLPQKPIDTNFRTWTELSTKWIGAINGLSNWAIFLSLMQEAYKSLAALIARDLWDGEIKSDQMEWRLVLLVSESLLNAALLSRPSLAQFAGALHEQKIEHFAKLDRELLQLNRQRLVSKLYQQRPSLFRDASRASEAGIIFGEIAKKRNHLPIRKLFQVAGNLIQKYTPCFMMSPLSIAQFLDPRSLKFDVVIFDEASQVRPEDALGALLRGKQLVAMGDTQQLPPTSFFDHLLQGESSDEYAYVSDVESILHLCKTRYPAKYLRWHYRSRHESLIATSNQELYDNRLLVYPASNARDENLGLKLRHYPETIYDRGRSQKNRKEAAIVANAVFEHFQTNPSKSLGIGTFNIQQQQAIQDELEMLISIHPEMDAYLQPNFREHVFVKNLETIQGDERDVIFVSIGYGRDENGKMSLNFGPLNQEGGERRLNVLITRAREKCVIFTNILSQDIHLDQAASKGLRLLKTYLEFAETGKLQSFSNPREDTESPFEEEVSQFLVLEGFEVHRQVGCAGFRIDLALVNPNTPGRYFIGIECDGYYYHNSLVARERDRLRQEILESMGWTIHRIWSIEWYRNPQACKDNLLQAIAQASANPNIQHHIRPDPPATILTKIQNNKEIENCLLRPLDSFATPYEFFSSILNLPRHLHPLDVSASVLFDAIYEITNVESPIPIEELVRRTTEIWGLHRSGIRISTAVQRAINYGLAKKLISRDGIFILIPGKEIRIRKRVGRLANIDLIHPLEIARAAEVVRDHQYRSPRHELIKQTARLLGIANPREVTIEKIGRIVDQVALNKD